MVAQVPLNSMGLSQKRPHCIPGLENAVAWDTLQVGVVYMEGMLYSCLISLVDLKKQSFRWACKRYKGTQGGRVPLYGKWNERQRSKIVNSGPQDTRGLKGDNSPCIKRKFAARLRVSAASRFFVLYVELTKTTEQQVLSSNE